MYNIKHLELETTNCCMLSCVFCPHKSMVRKQGVMTDETFNNILEQIKNLNISTAYCHQIGEPLIDPKLIQRINKLKKYIPFISISTNAMLLDKKMAFNLFASKLSELTLALDSLNKDTYEKLRIGGSFEKVKRNIDNCLNIRKTLGNNIKTKVELQVIVTKDNEHEIPEYKKEYGWLNDEEWGFLRIKEFSTFAGNVDNMSNVDLGNRNLSCPKLFNSIGIHFNGDIHFCCRIFEKPIPYLGNINNNNLIDVFNNNLYNNMRKEMKDKNFNNLLKFCKEC